MWRLWAPSSTIILKCKELRSRRSYHFYILLWNSLFLIFIQWDRRINQRVLSMLGKHVDYGAWLCFQTGFASHRLCTKLWFSFGCTRTSRSLCWLDISENGSVKGRREWGKRRIYPPVPVSHRCFITLFVYYCINQTGLLASIQPSIPLKPVLENAD